jgi:hypothetical protein
LDRLGKKERSGGMWDGGRSEARKKKKKKREKIEN